MTNLHSLSRTQMTRKRGLMNRIHRGGALLGLFGLTLTFASLGASRSAFDQDVTLKLPNGRTFGDVIQKAPGVFLDPSGNVSIGGATGLENIYIVNGLNVTGMEFGSLESGAASMGGGTNLPLEFLKQIDV